MIHLIRTVFMLVLLAAGQWPGYLLAQKPGDSYENQRQQMVTRQIRARGVRHPEVLRAMTVVPRHLFVPMAFRTLAYSDSPLPIGHDQTISQPYIVARMTELLDLKPGQRILEIGTGSGYQAAVLAEMGAQVFTIEIVPDLASNAQKVLSQLGYDNLHTRVGDGYKGWPRYAPFDAVIVTCSPTHVPAPLKDQLAEGGRMVIPVGPAGHQQLVLLRKRDNRIDQEKIFDVRFVPMIDSKGKNY